MKEFSDLIKDYLISKGINKEIYINGKPSGECVRLKTSGGIGPQHTFKYPNLEVFVHSFNDAFTICQQIYDLLHGLEGVQLEDAIINLMEAQQEPFFLTEDKNGFLVYKCNFSVTYQKA